MNVFGRRLRRSDVRLARDLNIVRDDPEENSDLMEFKTAFDGCQRDGPLMIYICKLFAMKGIDIQGGGDRIDREKEYEIALCRSFSGTITRNSPLFVIPSNHEFPRFSFSRDRSAPIQPQPLKDPIQLFVLMGREIAAVDEVPAGNVFGILGVAGSVMKMGTLSDTPTCPSLSSLRLAVEMGVSSHDRAIRSCRSQWKRSVRTTCRGFWSSCRF